MRRIIYAWNYIEWGGSQIHFLALIREARKMYETVVVLPEGTDPQFLGFLRDTNIDFYEFAGNIDLSEKRGIIQKLQRHLIRVRSEQSMLSKLESVGLTDAGIHTDMLPGQSLLTLIWLCIRVPVFITLHNAQPAVPKWRWMLWKIKFGVISMF